MTRRTGFGPRVWQALVATVAILVATPAPAAAQQPPAAAQQPSAPAQTLYRWTTPPAADQLAADTTVVPSGMGAVFVPAMTNGIDEPATLVYQGTQLIGSGPNGRRIVLTPGSYTLRIGSAPLDQTVSVPVDVTAGNTTLVPVQWGALVVEVVDENNVPHRGSYELIQVSDRQPYTVGFGADTLLGERIRTLLVGPGLYRIVRPGSNYRTRTDFSTVLVPAGGVVYLQARPRPGRRYSARRRGRATRGTGDRHGPVRLEPHVFDRDRRALCVHIERRGRREPDLDR